MSQYIMMQQLRDPPSAFVVELLLLALAAPALYFPARFPSWIVWSALGMLAAGWVWRRITLGFWLKRTPIDGPLFLLFLVLLPIAIWVPNEALRSLYSLPRAGIMVWCFCLFWVVVVYVGGSARHESVLVGAYFSVGVLVAVAALLGTEWVSKLPLLTPLLGLLPTVLVGQFEGAESGFSPNQVAGTLLYILPLLLALIIGEWRQERRRDVLTISCLAATLMGLVIVATQSRAGIVGLGVSILILVLAPHRWGRGVLLAGAIGILLTLLVFPVGDFLVSLDAATRSDIVNSGVNMSARFEIWQRAVFGIYSFPFTGMGLGTFRQIAPDLYPFSTIPPSYDIAHAHNFFLQVALDFGLPGLISVLAIYLLAVAQAVSLWKSHSYTEGQIWAIGFLAVLGGQTVYSMADAVAMGAKTHFVFWYFLALLFGIAQGLPRTVQISQSMATGGDSNILNLDGHLFYRLLTHQRRHHAIGHQVEMALRRAHR